jgi:hypothetical protein
MSIRMRVAPASSAFSTSSFTAEAGRSTTSPAAILFERISGRIRTRAMAVSPITIAAGSRSHKRGTETLQGLWERHLAAIH